LIGPQQAPPELWQAEFAVDPGREYDALGLYLHRGVMWVYVLDDFDRVRPAPLSLFRILDPETPRTWRVSSQHDGAVVFIAPPEASDLYFADKVENCDPLALKSLRAILAGSK
jgi:hypothetical protein